MDKNFIKFAAKNYYKENVEGEPLDQDVPIECFIAGANFILNAQKKRGNNCNISDYSSYNPKRNNVNDIDKFAKILTKVEKIMKIEGFYITANGDSSVGINPSTWELRNDFYFDNQEELEEFRKELKSFFESYCGEVADVLTFEEERQMIEAEERQYFEEFPVRYLILDKNYHDLYKQANSAARYSNDVGTAIHHKLPAWIPEEGNVDMEVIPSTELKFKKILVLEAERLEKQISYGEQILKNAKTNLLMIQKELKYGGK